MARGSGALRINRPTSRAQSKKQSVVAAKSKPAGPSKGKKRPVEDSDNSRDGNDPSEGERDDDNEVELWRSRKKLKTRNGGEKGKQKAAVVVVEAEDSEVPVEDVVKEADEEETEDGVSPDL